MNQDSNSLHWLKEFPSQFILSFLFLVVLAVYVHYQIEFLQRIIDLIAGGLLTTLIGARKGATTVNTDTIETPAVNTDSMDNNIINVEEDQEKEK